MDPCRLWWCRCARVEQELNNQSDVYPAAGATAGSTIFISFVSQGVSVLVPKSPTRPPWRYNPGLCCSSGTALHTSANTHNASSKSQSSSISSFAKNFQGFANSDAVQGPTPPQQLAQALPGVELLLAAARVTVSRVQKHGDSSSGETKRVRTWSACTKPLPTPSLRNTMGPSFTDCDNPTYLPSTHLSSKSPFLLKQLSLYRTLPSKVDGQLGLNSQLLCPLLSCSCHDSTRPQGRVNLAQGEKG